MESYARSFCCDEPPLRECFEKRRRGDLRFARGDAIVPGEAGDDLFERLLPVAGIPEMQAHFIEFEGFGASPGEAEDPFPVDGKLDDRTAVDAAFECCVARSAWPGGQDV